MKDTWDNNVVDLVQYAPKICMLIVSWHPLPRCVNESYSTEDLWQKMFQGYIKNALSWIHTDPPSTLQEEMKLKCCVSKHTTPISAKERSLLRKVYKDEKVIFSKHSFGGKCLSAKLLECVHNPQHL